MGELESVKFEWLSLRDLKLRTLLTTDPIRWSGRGCGGTSISSEKKGEILLTSDCLIIDQKYRDQQARIVIKI